MRLTLLFLATSFISTLSFSQKLKKEYFNFKYIKAPLTPTPMSDYYSFKVTEEMLSDKGIKTKETYTSSSLGHGPRSYFFTNMNCMGKINGFKKAPYKANRQPHEDTICNIDLYAGVLDLISKDVKKNGSIQGTTTPALAYQVTFSLPMSLVMYKEGQKEVYSKNEQSNNNTFTYTFPTDYKAIGIKGYATTGLLESAYQKNRLAFRLEIRNKIIQQWIYDTKMEISSLFRRSIGKQTVDVAYIKYKKGGYEDVGHLMDMMRILFEKINTNLDSGSQLNWHTSEIQTEFTKLKTDWEALLNAESEITVSGKAGRFDETQFLGLSKNWIWCMLFAGEYDEVISLCSELETQSNSNSLKNASKIFFSNVLEFAMDYKFRYERNKEEFGWY